MYAILFDSFVDNPDDTHECTVILGGIGPMALPVISGRIPIEASVFYTLGDALNFMRDAQKAELIVGLNAGNWRAVPVEYVILGASEYYKRHTGWGPNKITEKPDA